MTVSIKYIGKRETHRENLYGTGVTFTRGQVMSFPDDIAAKMLKHSDVYRRAAEPPVKAPEVLKPLQEVKPESNPSEPDSVPTVEVQPADKVQEDESQDLDDMLRSVDNMDKDTLSTYAKTYFNIELDKRKSVTALRQLVKTKIEQFGIE